MPMKTLSIIFLCCRISENLQNHEWKEHLEDKEFLGKRLQSIKFLVLIQLLVKK